MIDQKIIDFLSTLPKPKGIPTGVDLMHPYHDESVMGLVSQFYTKFYRDNTPRSGLFGINPGRHGAGLTGIPFTDPKRLKDSCGIETDLRSHEPSSEFVYMVVDRMGGPKSFYKQFFISSLCPLGFTMGGKNLNYYDRKDLQAAIEPYITQTLRQQISLGLHNSVSVILGAGKNLAFFEKLNEKEGFFNRVVALPHPRYIIQYKRRYLEEYLDLWERTLTQIHMENSRNVG